MKVTPKLICIFVVFWLALAPVHAAQPTKAKAKTSAKKSIKAKAGAKAKPKANATRLSRPARSALGARFDPANESSLDSEVAAARRIVTTKPGDVGARERLARASVAFIDLLLDAEALGLRYGLRLPDGELPASNGAAQRDECLRRIALFDLPQQAQS